ncbi:ferroxidase fet3 [Dipsacomyces acuminosporus]|nr:ferroxidase fet3 [Dipsacomyces acuminosporus]
MRFLNTFIFGAALAQAAQVIQNWDITYLNSSRGVDQPPRRGITVNGQFPIPPVYANIGDTLVLNVRNSLDVPTSIHAHGILQRGTNYYDGVTMTTECGIAPGSNFTYYIPLNQAGSFWLHSHNREQLFDGLRAPLIVKTNEPYQYDDEFTLAFEDWWPMTFDEFLNTVQVTTHVIPLDPPPRLLVNGLPASQSKPLQFKPGKTYRIRLISMLSLPHVEFSIDGHTMQVIEVDGVYTKQKPVNVVRLSSGQRVSVLVTAKSTAKLNYNYFATMMAEFLPTVPGVLPITYNSTVVYDPKAPLQAASAVPSEPFDDLSLENFSYFGSDSLGNLLQPQPLTPNRSLFLGAHTGLSQQYVPYDSYNYVTYAPPKVPSILSAMTTGSRALNPIVYGPQTNAQVLSYGEAIELVVTSSAMFPHAHHLHGHVFQIVERGYINDTTGALSRTIPTWGYNPVQRDTIYIPQGEYAVIRFKANNPGTWLFHCHFSLHMGMGMNMLFVEAPYNMQSSLKVPQAVVDQCNRQNIQTSGNVVGFKSYNVDGAPNMPHLVPVPGA